MAGRLPFFLAHQPAPGAASRPDPKEDAMIVTSESLHAASGILNLPALASKAGIPEKIFFSKLRWGTAFTDAEQVAIDRALREGLRPLFDDPGAGASPA